MIRSAVLLLLMFTALAGETFYLPQEMKKKIVKTYNKQALSNIMALVVLMNKLVDESEKNKLIAINNFFNAVPYDSDQNIWGKSDYWANRMEFLGKDRGDCEDYTFAKYFTLKQLGIDGAKMKAFYCKSLTYNQAHMVLAYFRAPKTTPFILGNYVTKIMPANKRTDLKPIKLYNSDDLFIAKLKQLGKAVPGSKKEALGWIEIINGIRRK